MPSDPPPEHFRRRLVAMFALATMEREGAIHGYRLAERIAEATDGRWRPGPGAIYPALQRLVTNRLARSRLEGRRRSYSITPSGKALLRRIRDRRSGRSEGAPDPGALWAEIHGVRDLDDFYLERLHRLLERLGSRLDRPDGEAEAKRRFRERLRLELTQALQRWEPDAATGRRNP